MKKKVVTATEFKTHCLALLNEMEHGGETITITRRGRPVAVLGPPERTAWKSPENSWAEKAEIVGDLLEDTSELWEVVRSKWDLLCCPVCCSIHMCSYAG